MRSIRTSLTLWLVIPLALVAALVAVETFYHARKVSNDLNDQTLLAASLAILEHVISGNGSLLADATLASLTESLGDRFFYHVRGPNGAFVTGYIGYPRPPDSDYGLSEPVFYDGIHLGSPVRAVHFLQDLTDRELNGVTSITTWQHTSQRQNLTLDLFARSFMRLVLLSLLAGTIVWFAVTAGLRPLARLQASIDKRSVYALSPIKQSVPAELTGIVASMNTLLARVERSKKNRERFIGDAAHQLRNPIAAITVQAQSSLEGHTAAEMREGLQQILNVSDKSAEMINKMLSGAQALAMEPDEKTRIDLNSLINERSLELAPLAFDKSQEFSVSHNEKQLFAIGNRMLLGEAISNIIHNAIQHNAAGSSVSVFAAESHIEGYVEILVYDSGEPIEEDIFLELTQPFRTDGANETGSGLGLSIAKDIIKMHQGELLSNKQHNGKSIVVRIPGGILADLPGRTIHPPE